MNVIWDGLTHAWIQDLMVASNAQRHGIGAALVGMARNHAREANCEWLHVDFDDDLREFYYDTCGFEPTNGGLIQLI
jgi:GNAT superfamily N-acetyltransferase